MAKARVELNSKGVQQLLKSREMQALVNARAKRIAAAAGPGHAVEPDNSGDRARASVVTRSYAAKKAEAKDRTLTRAIQAGR